MTKGERVAFSYGRSSCVSGTLMAPAYDGRMRSLVSESRAERGIRSNMRNMAAWYIGYACQAAVAGRGITQEQFRGMMTAVIQCDSPSKITEGWAAYEGKPYQIDGEIKILYPIGSGEWCWDYAEGQDMARDAEENPAMEEENGPELGM